MKVIRDLNHFDCKDKTAVVTIGNFDGMHEGHKAVLKRLCEYTDASKLSVVLTFSNHPSSVLHPERPTLLLCTEAHKIRIMESLGVDLLIILPFDKKFSEQSAKEFLHLLKERLHFRHMILGHDARFGLGRDGNPEHVQLLSTQMDFTVEYVKQVYQEGGAPISSSALRQLIQKGKIQKAKSLLGRKYSIASVVCKGNGFGKELGYPTANLNVSGLCLPPLGIYAVSVMIDNEKKLFGAANLGLAPTIRDDPQPILEVHIFDYNKNLYGHTIEVVFLEYIRPEEHFENIADLKQAITQDIKHCERIFSILSS